MCLYVLNAFMKSPFFRFSKLPLKIVVVPFFNTFVSKLCAFYSTGPRAIPIETRSSVFYSTYSCDGRDANDCAAGTAIAAYFGDALHAHT